MTTKYAVIEADCPWLYETYSDKGQGRGAVQHYATMTLPRLAGLPVLDVAAEHCVLLLWATWPNLLDALFVAQAWGFSYKTLGFIWVKRSRAGVDWHTGLGYWTRSNSEPCLLFTRGNPKRLRKDVHQLIVDDEDAPTLPGFEWEPETLTDRVLAHSAKPERFYRRVEMLLAGPYLSLFGRHERAGWTVLGDEVTGNDISDDLYRLSVSR